MIGSVKGLCPLFVSLSVASLAFTGCTSEEEKSEAAIEEAAALVCDEWRWNDDLTDDENTGALRELIETVEGDYWIEDVYTEAKRDCSSVMDPYRDYANGVRERYVETFGDESSEDEGVPEGSESSVEDLRNPDMFAYTVRELDATFRAESDDSLVALGAEVCEARRNGNPREDVIDLLSSLSGWSGMTSARFVVAADEYLC